MGERSAGLALVCACVGLLAAAAAADPTIEAHQLFDEGKALMSERRFGEACRKFEASHQLAPSAVALMNLGACQQADRKLASAWATFKEAGALAGRTDPALAEPSLQRAAALEPQLSSLRVSVPERSRVAGLEVVRNGVILVEAQWDSSRYVDGGEYEIVARAPGKVAWTVRVAVATELDQKSVEIPRLTEAATAVAGGIVAGPDRRDRGEPGRPRWTTLRKVGLGAAAGGVAALVGGGVLGLQARGYQADSDAVCPTTTCNDPEALRLNRDARSTGTRATILFVAGGALVAGGVACWYLGAPSLDGASRVGVAPMLEPGGGVGITVAGRL